MKNFGHILALFGHEKLLWAMENFYWPRKTFIGHETGSKWPSNRLITLFSLEDHRLIA
jgi:hypothetical protein